MALLIFSTGLCLAEELTDEAALVGVVLPQDSRPGDTVSGRIVTDTRTIDSVTPALQVVKTKVSVKKDEKIESTLKSVSIDTGDGHLQPADQPFTVKVPSGASKIPLTLVTTADRKPVASAEVQVSKVTTASRQTGYETPPLYVDTGVQVIRGPLSGDAHQTQVAADGKPGQILAETPRAVYWHLPTEAKAGAHEVTLRDGASQARFPVGVLHVSLSAERLTLVKGEATTFRATVSGPETLSPEQWQRAAVPSDLVDVARVSASTPKFRSPSSKDAGSVFVRIENQSKDTISLPRGDVTSLQLSRSDFAKGPYIYNGAIQSRQSGGFKINATAISFLAPITDGAAPSEEETPRSATAPDPTWEQIDLSGPKAKILDQQTTTR